MNFFEVIAPGHVHHGEVSQHQHILLFGHNGEQLTLIHIEDHNFLHVPTKHGEALLETGQKFPISYINSCFPAAEGEALFLTKPSHQGEPKSRIYIGEVRGSVSHDDQRVVEYMASLAVEASAVAVE